MHEEVKEARAQEIMELQQDISLQHNKALIGKELKVLIDRKEGSYFVGRTVYDSPEVDNEVLLPTDDYVRIGDFVKAKINDATEFDLFGRVKF